MCAFPNLLVHPLKWPQQPGLGQPGARSLELQFFHVGNSGPSTWVVFRCFPRCVSRKLAWKCGSQDLSWIWVAQHTSGVAGFRLILATGRSWSFALWVSCAATKPQLHSPGSPPQVPAAGCYECTVTRARSSWTSQASRLECNSLGRFYPFSIPGNGPENTEKKCPYPCSIKIFNSL